MFTTREIAIAVWLVAGACWALSKHEVRLASIRLVRNFFVKPILVSVGLMLIYNIVVIVILSSLGFWSTEHLKDTVFWFLFAAFPLTVYFVTSKQQEHVFRKITRESFTAFIFVEYITGTYTFPLLIELCLIPFLFFIVALDAVAKTNKQYEVVAKLTSSLLAFVGLAILGFSLYTAIEDYQNLLSLDALGSVFLTPLLSVLFSPFVFCAALYSQYEYVFTFLNVGRKKTPDVKRYAKLRLVQRFGLKLNSVRQFQLNNRPALLALQTKDDVDKLLQEK